MITEVLAAPGVGAFFFDDQAAIKAGARHDGFAIVGEPVTPGYEAIRQPASAVSIMLRLSDGHIAHGDCVAVQYSGVGGREPVLRADVLAALIEGEVAAAVAGLPVESFRELSAQIDTLASEVPGFGSAAAYGLSQAMLAAAAHATGRTMARTIQEEWGIEHELRRVPIYAQCGEERRTNVDKMILRQVDLIPHGLINSPLLVGADGEALVKYVGWVSERVRMLRRHDDYQPVLHFDVYGVVGLIMDRQIPRIADVLMRMEEAAAPFVLRVEHPLDAGSRGGQIEQLGLLREHLRAAGSMSGLLRTSGRTRSTMSVRSTDGAADVIQVKTPDLGGLHNSIEAVLTAETTGSGRLSVAPAARRTARLARVSMWRWRSVPTTCSPSPGWGRRGALDRRERSGPHAQAGVGVCATR